MSDKEPSPRRDLPAHRRRDELEELTPRQKRIERFASAYYGACRRVASAIRTLKGYLGDDEES